MAHATERIAMIVFNTCHADARVLREADTLQRAGHTVRIFAIANSKYPAGVHPLSNGVTIHRLLITSLFVAAFTALSALYHWLRRTEQLRDRRARREAALVDLRSRRERRESLARMSRRDRWARSWRLRTGAWGRKYRARLRTAYLAVHARLKRWLRPVHRPTQMLSFWRAADAAIREWRPTVVHAHDGNTLVPGLRAARHVNARLVYDSHELWRHRNRGGRLAPLGRTADALIERWAAPKAHAVITVSPGLVAWLERKYRLAGRVHLLRNTPSRVPSTEAPSLRDLAALTDDDKIVLYTGRITTGRGIEEAMDAVAGLPEHVHMVMLGYGQDDYVDGLFKRAGDLGILHRFQQVGPVPHEQVSAAAAQADVSVVAVQPTCLSYLHCLPNKLFEAIQAGLPVVASRLPDVAALLDEHQIGATFELGDADEMREAIQSALRDPAGIKANVARAAEVLCWEVEHRALLDLYASLRPRAAALEAALAPA